MAGALDPRTTVAVVLGASLWSDAGLPDAPSFRRSANAIIKWLIDSNGLKLEPDRLIDLFDSPASASDQTKTLIDKFAIILANAEADGTPIQDLLVFFIGHGDFIDSQKLMLLVRGTRKGHERTTSLTADDLAHTLHVSLPRQRHFVILDCCFAESALRSFVGMGPRTEAVASLALKELRQEMPSKGGLLLCSCAANEISHGPPQAASTLFTGAMASILSEGRADLPARYSFTALCKAVRDRVIEIDGANAPKPILHAYNQKEGSLLAIPAFRNAYVAKSSRASGRASSRVPARMSDTRTIVSKPSAPQANEPVESEARQKAQRKAQEKIERDAREEADRKARAMIERGAQEKAEREARQKAELQSRENAEQEARKKADRAVRDKAERERREKAARESATKAAEALREAQVALKKRSEKFTENLGCIGIILIIGSVIYPVVTGLNSAIPLVSWSMIGRVVGSIGAVSVISLLVLASISAIHDWLIGYKAE